LTIPNPKSKQKTQLTAFNDDNNRSNLSELELGKKIDYITKYNSKTYFKDALKRLAKVNPENANIICDYIIAEQTQMNIKESTKEGKTKVLIWLSNYF
jgi:hypothetical protein